MKGLVLCAGRGTRLYPFSFSQPKSLLPVANMPVLSSCITKLTDIGIKEIGIVINPGQSQIREQIGDGSIFGASITYVTQQQPLGIAHAIQLSESFIDGDSFALFLGDNLLQDSLQELHRAFLASNSTAAILLHEVNNPQDYGIAEIQGTKIISLEEKPLYSKSNLAVMGAYFFTSAIFEAITNLKPSKRGEYEITDAIQLLIKSGQNVNYVLSELATSDVGTAERWLEANRWMLKEKAGKEIISGEDCIITDCELIPPVIIGNNCRLSGSSIGPFVSIHDGVTISNCLRIENSILLQDSRVEDISLEITNSIFGRSSILSGPTGNKVAVFVLSDKSTVQFPQGKRAES
ncbi:sugar phosphate nucleotidyltransferase [Brevibacillus daliensis]|uniref:sugar phosphate nucleotidyltransferase n=1 Tax=Brevibacillus daliensis TaxID=2892995 RepID=UPI001E391AE0|nr:sugar phosphate nucleotidyltransferase [Brevibacillus daliensis]